MTSTSRLSVVSCVVAVALAACGRSVGGGPNDEFEPRRGQELTLEVRNQNFYDATLYAVWQSGLRYRLGTVSGNGKRTFTFRWQSLQLQIEIDLLSVGKHFTDPMPVDKGDELELVIEPALDRRIQLRKPRPRRQSTPARRVTTRPFMYSVS